MRSTHLICRSALASATLVVASLLQADSSRLDFWDNLANLYDIPTLSPATPPALAKSHPGAAELSAEQVFAAASKSVVVVRSFGSRWNKGELYYDTPRFQGSGVVVAPGTIATNCHVLSGGLKFLVTRGDKEYPARHYLRDKPRDICMLQVDNLDLPPVALRPTSTVSPGQRVYAIGAPQGLELSITEGIVSAVRGEGDGRALQTTAAISPGSSGGGLFDSHADLLGITTSQVAGQNLNFALPAEWIEEATPRVNEARERGVRSSKRFSSAADTHKANQEWSDLEVVARAWIRESGDYMWIPWDHLATALKEQRRYDEAMSAYKHAISLGADDKTRVDLARACFSKAFESDGFEFPEPGTTPPEEVLLGVDQLEAVLAIDPENIEALVEMIFWAEKLGNRPRALKLARWATEVHPDDYRTWSGLAFALGNEGLLVEALNAHLRTVELAPHSFPNWLAIKSLAESIGAEKLAREASDQLDRMLRTPSDSRK